MGLSFFTLFQGWGPFSSFRAWLLFTFCRFGLFLLFQDSSAVLQDSAPPLSSRTQLFYCLPGLRSSTVLQDSAPLLSSMAWLFSPFSGLDSLLLFLASLHFSSRPWFLSPLYDPSSFYPFLASASFCSSWLLFLPHIWLLSPLTWVGFFLRFWGPASFSCPRTWLLSPLPGLDPYLLF